MSASMASRIRLWRASQLTMTGRILSRLGAVETLWLAERDGAVVGLSPVDAQVWRDYLSVPGAMNWPRVSTRCSNQALSVYPEQTEERRRSSGSDQEARVRVIGLDQHGQHHPRGALVARDITQAGHHRFLSALVTYEVRRVLPTDQQFGTAATIHRWHRPL